MEFLSYARPVYQVAAKVMAGFIQAMEARFEQSRHKPAAPALFRELADVHSPLDRRLWCNTIVAYAEDLLKLLLHERFLSLQREVDKKYEGGFPDLDFEVFGALGRLGLRITSPVETDGVLKRSLEEYSKRFYAILGNKNNTAEVKNTAMKCYRQASQLINMKESVDKGEKHQLPDIPTVKLFFNKKLAELNRLQGLDYKALNKVRTMRRVNKLRDVVKANSIPESATSERRVEAQLEELLAVMDALAPKRTTIHGRVISGGDIINSLDDLAKDGVNMKPGVGFPRELAELADTLDALYQTAQWILDPRTIPKAEVAKAAIRKTRGRVDLFE